MLIMEASQKFNPVFFPFTDNFAHRAAVRKAVINDKEWQEKLAAILPLLDKQHMEIAYMVPWCELGTPPKEGQLACSST